MDYTPSSIEFEADIKNAMTNYVPGELSINVEQYPKVEIEYMGEPMYVPPSAAPGYERER